MDGPKGVARVMREKKERRAAAHATSATVNWTGRKPAEPSDTTSQEDSAE